MPNIIDVVLPTFVVIFIGYLIGKLTRISIEPVVDITLYIGVPALVFVSLVTPEIVLLDAAKVWTASIVIMFGCLAVAWIVFRLSRQRHSGLYIAIALMNSVNIPFPIVYLTYGTEGLAAATLFYIPNIITIYTFGVYVMAGGQWRENLKEVIKLPVVYAATLGLIFNFANVSIPELAMNTLDFISLMAIPLVLIILGHNLSSTKMSSLPTTFLASFLRIGVGLGIGLLAVYILDITGVYRSVVVLDSAMPAAAVSALLSTKYNNEAGLVSSVVLVTTIASLIVIPLLLRMLA